MEAVAVQRAMKTCWRCAVVEMEHNPTACPNISYAHRILYARNCASRMDGAESCLDDVSLAACQPRLGAPPHLLPALSSSYTPPAGTDICIMNVIHLSDGCPIKCETLWTGGDSLAVSV